MIIRILLAFLVLVCLIMGVHYMNKRFGIGPGLPDLTANWPRLSQTPLPVSTSSASPTATASGQETVVPQQLNSLLAVPLQLDANGLAPDSVSLEYISKNKSLMVILFGSNLPATTVDSVVKQLQSLPEPPLIAVDHEGGMIQPLSGPGFTQLPSWQQWCALPADKRAGLIASSAAELKKVGIDVVFGPVIDLAASGSALKSRSCASDPDLVAARAQELVSGYRAVGLTPVLKHYPGIGSAKSDLRTQSVKVVVTPDDTRPYEVLLGKNPSLPVMISHLRVDPPDPETPCSMSFVCVGELHRVFPDSILLSDALEMKAAGYLASSSATLRPLPERASAAIRAGIDIVIFGPTVTEADLQRVTQQLEHDFVVNGGLNKISYDHIVRVQDWRASLRQ